MTPSPHHPSDRRQVLRGARDLGALGALGAVGLLTGSLTGCRALEGAADRVGLGRGTPAPAATPPETPSEAAEPDDPDVRLAVEVLLLSESAARALRTWSTGGRGSRRTRPLALAAAATHDAHATLLGGAVPATAGPGTGGLAPRLLEATRSRGGTLRSAARIEELAGAGLREAALTARSGAFASLLAAMAAASAQHAAVVRAGAAEPVRR